MATSTRLRGGNAAFRGILLACACAFLSPAAASAGSCVAQSDNMSCGPRPVIMYKPGENEIISHLKKEFGDHKQKDFSATEGQKPKTHEEWMINVFFKKEILPALRKLDRQGVAVDNQQAMARGMFIDADNQIDSQRDMQRLSAETQGQYQPSEELCVFGTNVRSLASSEELARDNAARLASQSLSRQLGASGTAGATSPDADKEARWRKFVTTYCDPLTNNPDPKNPAKTGLALACGAGASDKTRMNKDIDFGRLIESPRTLDVNFSDSDVPADEEDVIAFIDNVFPTLSRQPGAAEDLGLRSVAARRGVAQNSLSSIIGMKSAGTSDKGRTREFLASVVKQLGVPEDQIYPLIGEKPSYYAQLEIMAKRLYQTPQFYADLYDTPDNVNRKGVALRAIGLMVDRAIYESQLRREMVVSALLANELKDSTTAANRALGGDAP